MDKAIGKRIEKILEVLDMTSKELAVSLKTDPTHMKRIISGKNKGSDTLYAFICCKYNINPQWLETGEGDIYSDCNLLNFSRVLDIYKKLDTNHQKYMFYNLEKLLELQNKNRETEKQSDI